MKPTQMTVKMWGGRGSIPRPEQPRLLFNRVQGLLEEFSISGVSPGEFLQAKGLCLVGGYGGNTTCVQVHSGAESLIVDGGSGIRELGVSLMAGPLGRGQGEAHILMTHFHWDHLIGIPFFIPIFIPGNRIHFYAVQPELESAIRMLFSRPYFPVDFAQLPATVEFHSLVPRHQRQIAGFGVTPYELDHPDPCWGFRIEKGGSAYAHCVDSESTRQTSEELGMDRPLYSNADLMFFDAQYSLSEVVDKQNWGHGVASFGIDIALREKIKNVWFVHHDPYATDQKIAAAEAQTRAYYESCVQEKLKVGEQVQPVLWSFAVEGMELEI